MTSSPKHFQWSTDLLKDLYNLAGEDYEDKSDKPLDAKEAMVEVNKLEEQISAKQAEIIALESVIKSLYKQKAELHVQLKEVCPHICIETETPQTHGEHSFSYCTVCFKSF